MRVIAQILLAAAVASTAAAEGFAIVEGTPVKVASFNDSILYNITTSGDRYFDRPQLLDLRGKSRYDMGYAMGVLTGNGIESNYDSLLRAVLGNSTLEPAEQALFGDFLDWQWGDYLSVQTPQVYLDELRGVEAGAQSIGVTGAGKCMSRGNVLANFPGDMGDLLIVLTDELYNGTKATGEAATPAGRMLLESAARAGFNSEAKVRGWVAKMASQMQGHHCSMIGAWGPRTEGGRVLTGRNLDWESRTGIDEHKLIVVYHPPEGGHAHATIGFSTVQGALTGMSSEGLTVHEANLEESSETFRGFPWLLRLRYLMEHAEDLASARAVWEATNNTVGFNHGVGSAKDQSFMALETEAWYTAYFGANDPREAKAVDPKSGKPIGGPMPNALWRTNHGYDPKIQQDFMWSQSPTSNTVFRYMLIRQTLLDYEQASITMGPADLVNATAIVGQKGGKDWMSCDGVYDGGSNVLSVAFDPSNLEIYAAWESGPKGNWAPAACSDYLHIDMKPFLHH